MEEDLAEVLDEVSTVQLRVLTALSWLPFSRMHHVWRRLPSINRIFEFDILRGLYVPSSNEYSLCR